jgi:arsenate reductase
METSKIQLFGIPNCDSVKKARTWLDQKGLEYDFQDFKKIKINEDQIEFWCSIVDWVSLVNKKSTTWRGLSKIEQDFVIDQKSACEILLKNPSLVKRPVIWQKKPTNVVVGVQPALWEKLFDQ